jgi:hypothetical protein
LHGFKPLTTAVGKGGFEGLAVAVILSMRSFIDFHHEKGKELKLSAESLDGSKWYALR